MTTLFLLSLTALGSEFHAQLVVQILQDLLHAVDTEPGRAAEQNEIDGGERDGKHDFSLPLYPLFASSFFCFSMAAGWFILPEKETDIIIQLSAAD